MYEADIVGAKGAGYGTGAVTITAPGAKKIHAIGVHQTANVTNLKYTPPKSGDSAMSRVTVSDLQWMGISLTVTGPTAFIPLGFDADEVTIASGAIFVYYR